MIEIESLIPNQSLIGNLIHYCVRSAGEQRSHGLAPRRLSTVDLTKWIVEWVSHSILESLTAGREPLT